MEELAPYMRGRRSYFGFCETAGGALVDGGSWERGHFGREKGASAVVTQWPAVGAVGPRGGTGAFQSEGFSRALAFSAR